MRELYMINDYNNYYAKYSEKYNMSPMLSIEKGDIGNILMASDLWHLPLGNIRSIITNDKNTDFKVN